MKAEKTYAKVDIAALESSANPNPNWRHGVGVTKVEYKGEERVTIGNVWYPENGTAFLKGACSLTPKEALQFAKMIIEKATAAPTNPIVSSQTKEEIEAGKRRGRPPGSKNKPKGGEQPSKPKTAPVETPEAPEVSEETEASDDNVVNALKDLGLSDAQLKEIGM